MNKELQARTEAQQSKTAELLPSANLAQNPMLCDVDSYKSVLEIFRFKDNVGREWIKKPFVIDSNVYSTDSHCMVWFDKNNITTFSEYDVYEKTKIGTVIPTEINIEKEISVDEIKKGLEKCPTEEGFDLVGEYVPCKECDGEGTVIWEYNNHEKEWDCPVCDGDCLQSKKRQKPNGKKTIPTYAIIKLEQCFISANIFESIVKAAEFLNQKSVKLISQVSATKASLFEIGDVSLLVMPVMPPDSYENVAYNIA